MKLFAVAILVALAVTNAYDVEDTAALQALAGLGELSAKNQLLTTTRMSKKCPVKKEKAPKLFLACSCYFLKISIRKIKDATLKKIAKRSARQCRRLAGSIKPRRSCRKLGINPKGDPRKSLRRLQKLVRDCFGLHSGLADIARGL